MRRPRRGGEGYYAAELHRLEAGYLTAKGAPPEAVEASLERAIAVAGRQGARMPALRASLLLGRRLHERGRGDEARALLLRACAESPEEPGPTELIEARALLDSTGMKASRP
jgi:predicted ATPase